MAKVSPSIQQPHTADPFFAEEAGLVQSFVFDYEQIIEFHTKVGEISMICPLSWICCQPCLYKQQIEWHTRARHVALTQDGIKYVVDKHKTGCGYQCADAGKTSQTVPYDKITDCDVSEPAGMACCCCIPNVLHTVSVATASEGGGLWLTGLSNPQQFKEAVWAMKRGGAISNTEVAPTAVQMTRPGQVMGLASDNNVNTQLLTEIRDELRMMNANMAK
jgi:hypothetical protein